MNKTCFLSMLLGCAFSCALLKTVSAAPNSQRPPVISGPIIKSDRVFPQAGELMVGEPIPLMTDLFNYARTGSIARKTKTAVYATVTIASAGPGFSASNSRTTYANGELTLAGEKGKEHFEGRLRVAHNSGDADAPFSISRAAFLKLRIYRNGRVSATYSVPIKKSSQTMSFVSDGADGFLWGRDASGSGNLISVAFAKSVSGETAAPPVSTPPPPAAPRGMKVRVGGEIRVTNSDDGVADRQVEMFGNVNFNGQERWNVRRSSARDQDKGDVILLDFMTVDVIFDDPSTWNLKVGGYLYDRDMTKSDVIIQGDDAMWNVTKYLNKIVSVDLKQMVETQSSKTTLYGDGDSENANVIIKASKLADIF